MMDRSFEVFMKNNRKIIYILIAFFAILAIGVIG